MTQAFVFKKKNEMSLTWLVLISLDKLINPNKKIQQ
jgi:hypothetical protein